MSTAKYFTQDNDNRGAGSRGSKGAKSFTGAMRGNTQINNKQANRGNKYAFNTTTNLPSSATGPKPAIKQINQVQPLKGLFAGTDSHVYPAKFDRSKFGPATPVGPIPKKTGSLPW